jgi:DnaK suppressor protein
MKIRKEKLVSARLSPDKLERFKTELLARRESLSRELEGSTDAFINDEQSYTDSVDQASADVDKSFAVKLKNRERGVLGEINEALRRIDQGIFGLCERCDDPISEARMRANPSTTLCIDCKAELESEQHRFSGKD